MLLQSAVFVSHHIQLKKELLSVDLVGWLLVSLFSAPSFLCTACFSSSEKSSSRTTSHPFASSSISALRGAGAEQGNEGQVCPSCLNSCLQPLLLGSVRSCFTILTFCGTATDLASLLRCISLVGNLSVQCCSTGFVSFGGVLSQRFVPMKCDLTSLQ